MLLKHFLFFLVVACFYTSGSHAQIGDVINTHISSEKISHSQKSRSFDTKRLALQITKDNSTDLEKAKAIFIWIAQNIKYDTELRTDKALQKEFYISEESVMKKVLERKKALCGGYAFLYRELCMQIGIESEVIHGYSKKYYATSKARKQADHSWNAVKINGTWHLLDLTLAVSQQQNRTINMYWFDTNPAYFIKTHYPEDTKWSLLLNPISKSEFERIPVR